MFADVTLLPVVLMSVAMRTVARFPVGRVCTYPLELQTARLVATGGFSLDTASRVVIVAAARAAISVSNCAALVTSPGAPAMLKVTQSAASGCALNAVECPAGPTFAAETETANK